MARQFRYTIRWEKKNGEVVQAVGNNKAEALSAYRKIKKHPDTESVWMFGPDDEPARLWTPTLGFLNGETL